MSYQENTSARMSDAIAAGKYVVLKPAFQTIPDTHKPNILNGQQKAGLNDAFSVAAAKWEQDHYGRFVTFQVGSAEKLIDTLKVLKSEALKADLTGAQLSDRLKISKHRILSPWRAFFPDTRLNALNPIKRDDQPLHITDIAKALFANSERQSARERVPALTPVLRRNMQISMPGSVILRQSANLVTDQEWNMKLEERVVRVQDLIRVKDKAFRERIIAAEEFSFVATPFVERWNLSSVLHDTVAFPFNVIWDISNEKQVVLHNEGARDIPAKLIRPEKSKPAPKQPAVDDRQFTFPI